MTEFFLTLTLGHPVDAADRRVLVAHYPFSTEYVDF
jgi:hypothetical protein